MRTTSRIYMAYDKNGNLDMVVSDLDAYRQERGFESLIEPTESPIRDGVLHMYGKKYRVVSWVVWHPKKENG